MPNWKSTTVEKRCHRGRQKIMRTPSSLELSNKLDKSCSIWEDAHLTDRKPQGKMLISPRLWLDRFSDGPQEYGYRSTVSTKTISIS
jgi:hypothetical protein